MTESPLSTELATVFTRMSGLLLSEQTVASALSLVTSLAEETLPGTMGAGVTLVDQAGGRTSAAATDADVERVDRLQYDLGEGPCLTAWAERRVVRIDDLQAESRWSRWCTAAGQLRVRSVLSAPLVAGDSAFGAMKVYSDTPDAYGQREERRLTLFAAQAAVLIANMQSYDNAQRLSESLKAALRDRDVIGQAKGMLIERNGVDEDAAFAMLVAIAQQERRKLHDVAYAMVESASRRRP